MIRASDFVVLRMANLRSWKYAPYAATLMILLVAYSTSLALFFPGYFKPLDPVNIDTFYHFGLGQYSWEIDLAAPRPVAWVFMKIASQFGTDGITLCCIAATILGLFFLTLAFRELTESRWEDFFMSLPVYTLALFGHPQFYIKHRDDFELEIAFFFLALGIFFLAKALSTKRTALLIPSLAALALAPFSKETFWLAAPVLCSGIAYSQRFNRSSVIAMIASFVATAVAYASLRTHSFFLNGTTNLYGLSLDPASITSLWGKYLILALTLPTLVLCVVGLWNVRRNRRARFVLIFGFVAGIVAYIPNSFLPNNFKNWYAWDGLALLLLPLLSVFRRPEHNV